MMLNHYKIGDYKRYSAKKTILMALLLVYIAVAPTFAVSYRTTIFDANIRSLRMIVGDDRIPSSVVQLNENETFEISFDELGYSPSYFYYRIIHLDERWEDSHLPSFEYLNGRDGNMFEDYEFSNGTLVNYVHYWLNCPNDDFSFKISGNYVMLIGRDNSFENENLVAQICFSVVEKGTDLSIEYIANTLLGNNSRFQQLSVSAINQMGGNAGDYILMVRQNERLDNEVYINRPTYIMGNQFRYANDKALVFEGGNGYRSIDFSSRYTYGGGIDRIKYDGEVYHVLLEPSYSRAKRYKDDRDVCGSWIVNLQHSDEDDIQADYMYVEFTYPVEEILPAGRYYLMGGMTYNAIDENTHLVYDQERKAFVKTLLLKQGGYNFIYGQEVNGHLVSLFTEGSFWQARNRYQAYLYYKPAGARYTRLVGYASVITNE